MRNAVVGLALGLVLGLGLAFLWEALDPRVRSAEAVTNRLRLPLLGRIPKPPRRLAKNERLVMLDDPNGPHAEAFRILRTNFEFLTVESGARSVLVTSAIESEGKTTTAANLAVALARAGRRVTLVDLDLRRPSLQRFFALPAHPGLTDVALGRVPLAAAIVPVDLGDRAEPGSNGSRHALSDGRLDVLPSGSPPTKPGEFVARLRLGPILDYLQERSDIILVDGPPLLPVGDAIAASSAVDALLVVARLNVVRRPMLDDLARVLAASPAATLGVIVAGADLEIGYDYLTYRYDARVGRRSSEVTPSPRA